MSSDWAYETAKAIVDDTRFNFYYSPHYERQWTLDAIAAALRTAHKVPEGCVRDDKGVDRKVLGTLPVTADGCVVTPEAIVFAIDPYNYKVEEVSMDPEMWRTHGHRTRSWRATGCYSTREAAVSAVSEAAQAALAARGDGKAQEDAR